MTRSSGACRWRVEATCIDGRSRALTERTPEDSRTLAHHAAGCGDDAAAAHHAKLAARACRDAQRTPRGCGALPDGAATRVSGESDRAALFVALSYECYLTDQLPEALAARQRALELHELAGEPALVGDDERWLSRLSWFLGRGSDAERYAARAIASLEPLGPSRALAMAYSNFAQLRMLARRRRAGRESGPDGRSNSRPRSATSRSSRTRSTTSASSP